MREGSWQKTIEAASLLHTQEVPSSSLGVLTKLSFFNPLNPLPAPLGDSGFRSASSKPENQESGCILESTGPSDGTCTSSGARELDFRKAVGATRLGTGCSPTPAR